MRRKITLIRKFKYYFFKFGIHKILPGYSFNFLGHLSQLSRWIANNNDIAFTSFPNKNFDYTNRKLLHQYLLENEIGDEPIDYLEFGVAQGKSFRWWIANSKHPDSRFYGFDTFTGLPEDWGPFKKGAMSNGSEPPKIDDPRGEFFTGLFQQTLYPFLKKYPLERKKVIHLDADLYSATWFVLASLSPYLKKGDLILFDEFNVPLHEFKAFKEWSESFYIDYTVIGEVNNFYQMALKLN